MVTRSPLESSTDSRMSKSTKEVAPFFAAGASFTALIFPTTNRPGGNMALGSGMKSSLNSFKMTRPSTDRERRTKHPFFVVETTYACAISFALGTASLSKAPFKRDSRKLNSNVPFDLAFPRTLHLKYLPSGKSLCTSSLSFSSSLSNELSSSFSWSASESETTCCCVLRSCAFDFASTTLPNGMFVHSFSSVSSVMQQRPIKPPRKLNISDGGPCMIDFLLIRPITTSERCGFVGLNPVAFLSDSSPETNSTDRKRALCSSLVES
mmetsp:Transcript_32255/g.65572  ORF Transcript_32255/g.65572 Transcript_32255/m.65572 type:complete len:266 (-) Transcript_32255:1340-2137(-)